MDTNIPQNENFISKETILSDQEKKKFYNMLRLGGYRDKKFLLKRIAKEKNLEPEEILNEIRHFAKQGIRFPEKVLHFHKTGIDNFKSIVEIGGFLSRSELKKRNPDIKISSWSASDDFMMTQDEYDKDGELIKRGLSPHGVGASEEDIVFVLGPSIINLDDYDCIIEYPTVSNAPVKGNCTKVLVENEDDKIKVKGILEKAGLDEIEIKLRDKFEEDHYSEKNN